MMDKFNLADAARRIIGDIIEEIIGDTPVSVQLANALHRTASKKDVADLYAEVELLKKEVEKLVELVGDTPVSEQINIAMNRSEN